MVDTATGSAIENAAPRLIITATGSAIENAKAGIVVGQTEQVNLYSRLQMIEVFNAHVRYDNKMDWT